MAGGEFPHSDVLTPLLPALPARAADVTGAGWAEALLPPPDAGLRLSHAAATQTATPASTAAASSRRPMSRPPLLAHAVPLHAMTHAGVHVASCRASGTHRTAMRSAGPAAAASPAVIQRGAAGYALSGASTWREPFIRSFTGRSAFPPPADPDVLRPAARTPAVRPPCNFPLIRGRRMGNLRPRSPRAGRQNWRARATAAERFAWHRRISRLACLGRRSAAPAAGWRVAPLRPGEPRLPTCTRRRGVPMVTAAPGASRLPSAARLRASPLRHGWHAARAPARHGHSQERAAGRRTAWHQQRGIHRGCPGGGPV